MLPASSVALTWKLWVPSDRLLYDLGLEQLLQLPESNLHLKEIELSLLLNVKVADWLFVGFSGPEVTLDTGPVESMVQFQYAGLPATRGPEASAAM